MDEQPKKRRGPLLWLAGRSRAVRVAAAAMLPVLYVMSVGPGQYLCAHQLLPVWAITIGQVIYLPLAVLPPPFDKWVERYADWFAHALP